MGGQILTVRSVVASNVRNDCNLASSLHHYIFQHNLPFCHAVIDAFTRGTADIETVDALANQIPCECSNTLWADFAFVIIAGIECRDHALILFDVHRNTLQSVI